MKNSKIALTAILIVTLAVTAYLLMGKQPNNISPTAQNTQPQPEAVDKTAKENSLSNKKYTEATNAESVAEGISYLTTQMENRLKQMSEFKSKVENTTGFDEAKRKMVVDELNDEIGEFVTLRPEVNKSETKEEVKNVAEKIKAVWLKSRITVDKAQGELVAAKERSVLSEAENFGLGLKKRIEILKASGKNTKEREEFLANYNEKIVAAKKESELALETIKTIDNAETNEEKEKLKKENEELLKSSHENIKEAFKMLKDEAKQEFSQRF